MTQPLRSPFITKGSSLLRAGPPAHPATVLNLSQFLLLEGLPAAADSAAAVSECTFPSSMRKQQARLTLPPRGASKSVCAGSGGDDRVDSGPVGGNALQG